MSTTSQYSLQGQLIELSTKIEDKIQVCRLEQEKLDRERASINVALSSVEDELKKQYDTRVQELQNFLNEIEAKSSKLFAEKVTIRRNCEDMIALMKEEENDFNAMYKSVSASLTEKAREEQSKFNAGAKARRSQYLASQAQRIKDETEAAMESQFNNIRAQHDQEIAEVDAWLRNEEKQLQAIMVSRLKVEEEQEAAAAKDELRMSLKAVADKGKEECDAEIRDHLRAMKSLQETLDKDLDRQRALLLEKSQKLRKSQQLELKSIQEANQTKLADLKATHEAYKEKLHREHEEQISQLKLAAKQSLARSEAALRKEQNLILLDDTTENPEKFSDSEGEESCKVSPTKEPARNYRESEELAKLRREWELQREKQLRSDLTALETQNERLRRQLKQQLDQKAADLNASANKEEESLQRRIHQYNDELASKVVDRERLLRLAGELREQEETKTQQLCEMQRSIAAFKEGIGANRQLIRDKEAALKLRLRELQMEVGPQIRQLRERCDELEGELRRKEREAEQDRQQSTKDHEMEINALHNQVTKDVCKIEEDIQKLRDSIEEQRARNNTLQSLIRDYKRTEGNGSSSNSNGRSVRASRDSDSDDDEPRTAAPPKATTSNFSVGSRSTMNRHIGSTYSTASTLTHQSGVSRSGSVVGGGGLNSTTGGSRLRPDSASAASRLSRK